MRATRNLLLAPFLSLALAGCDGEIVVAGTVSDEQGSGIAAACVYLGDRVYNDSLNDYLNGKRDDLACRDETDSEGRFKAIAGVAGSGKHDFWIVAWKEAMLLLYEKAGLATFPARRCWVPQPLRRVEAAWRNGRNLLASNA
jgi:hypothetical protein